MVEGALGVAVDPRLGCGRLDVAVEESQDRTGDRPRRMTWHRRGSQRGHTEQEGEAGQEACAHAPGACREAPPVYPPVCVHLCFPTSARLTRAERPVGG